MIMVKKQKGKKTDGYTSGFTGGNMKSSLGTILYLAGDLGEDICCIPPYPIRRLLVLLYFTLGRHEYCMRTDHQFVVTKSDYQPQSLVTLAVNRAA